MNLNATDRTQVFDRKAEIREDFINCTSHGKKVATGTFILAFGSTFLGQYMFMYKTKKFIKPRNRLWVPLGTAFLISYGSLVRIYMNCFTEMKEKNLQLMSTKESPEESSSFEFADEDHFIQDEDSSKEWKD